MHQHSTVLSWPQLRGTRDYSARGEACRDTTCIIDRISAVLMSHLRKRHQER